MRFLTLRAVLAAALFSLVVVIPALPPAKTGSRWFALEARIASAIEGTTRVYFDVGHGYVEADSVGQPLVRSETPRLYRFALPAGAYRSLRLDLTDRTGAATLHAPLRIVSNTGRVVRDLPLPLIHPLHQVESLVETNGALRVVTTADADDPQLVISFSPPLAVRLTAVDFLTLAWRPSLVVFAAFTVLLFALDRAASARRRLAESARHLGERPARAVMLVAVVSVVASAYPVVFLGKSYVSPNFGTTLLYDRFPTLPNQSSGALATVNGSDVGAAMWQNVPYSFIQRRALAQGELPLWNRYTLTGTPLLAQAQSMLGDPLHLVVLLFDGAAWAWDLKYLIAKWLFAAGVGLLALALLGERETNRDNRTAGQRDHRATPGGDPGRRQSETRATLAAEGNRPMVTGPVVRGPVVLSSLAVAAAAPFIGFYLYRINHPAIFAVGYAPWVLYCWIRLARADGRRPAAGWLGALLLANVALMNSGTVKEAYLLVAQMNFAGAAVLLAGTGVWRFKLAKLAGGAGAGALLLLINAPVWATFVETLPHAYTAAADPFANQIQPALLLGAFDELFFRHLSAGEIVFNPSLNLLFLLGGLYFAATLRWQFPNPEAMALAGCALLFSGFVFGAVPPAWITQVPLLGKVWHVDNCFLGGLLVLGPVLAAFGFRAAFLRLPAREGRDDLIIAATLLLVIVGAWLGFRHAAHRQTYGPGTTISLLEYGQVIPVSAFVGKNLALMLLASVGLTLVARRALGRRALGSAGAVVAALCLVILLWRHGAHHSGFGFETYLLQPPARADFHARSEAIADVQSRHGAEPGRVLGLHANLTPAWNAVYGLEAIHGPDALQHRALRELIDASPLRWNSGWSLSAEPAEVGAARPFLDALNVRYYVDRPGNAAPVDPSLHLARTADLNVYESHTAWPRAFFTDSFTTYTNAADLVAKMVASQGRPFASVQRDELPAYPALSKIPRDATPTRAVQATKYRLNANTTSFAIRAERPGIVVLAEAWWPAAFRATLNGRRVPVLRVNHAFKGIVIDTPGEYDVAFSYWPRNFTRNVVLHALGVMLALGSLVLARRRRQTA